MTAYEELRAQICARYGSVHAFCLAHPELKRSTVYLVLSGRYPGKIDRQVVRIRASLHGIPEQKTQQVERDELARVLQEIRCGNCRRLDKRACMECRTRTAAESMQLYDRLF